MDETITLKELNPTAYDELIDFYPEFGVNMYTKENLPACSEKYFGIWKCNSSKHNYITTVSYRATSPNDECCPICVNKKYNFNPQLLATRTLLLKGINRFESLWYCQDCYYISWIRNTENKYNLPEHICYESVSLNDEYPEIAKEWSTHNFTTANKIAYNPDLDYEFEWLCPVCNNSYKMSMHKKIILKSKACPQCHGDKNFIRKPAYIKYPQLKNDWCSELNDVPLESVYEDDRTVRYLKCSKCGVIILDNIENYYNNKECPLCKAGLSKDESSRIYNESGIDWTKHFLDPNQHEKINWRCEKCGQPFSLSPKQRFFKQEHCPYCNHKYGIPGKTSFKALYPDIEREMINEDNTDTDRIAVKKNSIGIGTQRQWKCPKCNYHWKASIYDRIYLNVSCPYCIGKYGIPGKTSFKALYPDIEREMINENNTDTDRIAVKKNSTGIKTQRQWKCPKCNCYWKASIYDRIHLNFSCPYCENSIYSLNNDLIENEWIWKDNVLLANPRYTYVSSHKIVWWKCNVCNRHYKYSIYNRIKDYHRNRNSCIFCRGLNSKIRRN